MTKGQPGISREGGRRTETDAKSLDQVSAYANEKMNGVPQTLCEDIHRIVHLQLHMVAHRSQFISLVRNGLLVCRLYLVAG